MLSRVAFNLYVRNQLDPANTTGHFPRSTLSFEKKGTFLSHPDLLLILLLVYFLVSLHVLRSERERERDDRQSLIVKSFFFTLFVSNGRCSSSLRALYKGYAPKVLRLGPGGGILKVVFDKVSLFLAHQRQKMDMRKNNEKHRTENKSTSPKP